MFRGSGSGLWEILSCFAAIAVVASCSQPEILQGEMEDPFGS
jgi:hypothetical protein